MWPPSVAALTSAPRHKRQRQEEFEQHDSDAQRRGRLLLRLALGASRSSLSSLPGSSSWTLGPCASGPPPPLLSCLHIGSSQLSRCIELMLAVEPARAALSAAPHVFKLPSPLPSVRWRCYAWLPRPSAVLQCRPVVDSDAPCCTVLCGAAVAHCSLDPSAPYPRAPSSSCAAATQGLFIRHRSYPHPSECPLASERNSERAA